MHKLIASYQGLSQFFKVNHYHLRPDKLDLLFPISARIPFQPLASTFIMPTTEDTSTRKPALSCLESYLYKSSTTVMNNDCPPSPKSRKRLMRNNMSIKLYKSNLERIWPWKIATHSVVPSIGHVQSFGCVDNVRHAFLLEEIDVHHSSVAAMIQSP